MEANALPALSSKSSSSLFLAKSLTTQISLRTTPRRHQSLRAGPSTSSTSTSSPNDGDTPPPVPPPSTLPDTVEIRFRRGSRKRSKQQQDGSSSSSSGGQSKQPSPPKEWETMTITEKAVELYMGEKGLLFWLNKFAYASIFIIIGAWILFRFVGPSLGLYELDSAPLTPSTMLKS